MAEIALPLSARSREALRELASAYAGHLRTHPDHDLIDLAGTAWTGRAHGEHQLAVLGSSTEGLARRLEAACADGLAGEGIATAETTTASDRATTAWAICYTRGTDLDGASWQPPSPRQRLALPCYPFRRERHWLQGRPEQPLAMPALSNRPAAPLHPLLLRRIHSASRDVQFEALLDTRGLLSDHRVQGTVVVSSTVYAELVLSAVHQAFQARQCRIEQVVIHSPLMFDEQERRLLQPVFTPGQQEARYQVYSAPAEEADGEWTLHASGQVYWSPEQNPAKTEPQSIEALVREIPGAPYGSVEFYATTDRIGLQFGPTFQWVEKFWRQTGRAVVQLRRARPDDAVEAYQFHPGLLDACFQTLGATLPAMQDSSETFLLLGMDKMSCFHRPEQRLWCHVRLRGGEAGAQEIFSGDVTIFEETGRIIAEVEGLHFKRAPRQALLRVRLQKPRSWLHQIVWRPQPLPASATEALWSGAGQGLDWLIVGDPERLGERLRQRLEQSGADSGLVRGDALAAVLEERRACAPPPRRGVIHLASLEAPVRPELSARDIEEVQRQCVGSALALVQAPGNVVTAPSAPAPRLWLVTRGAVAIAEGDTLPGLLAAPLWGLSRVITLEYPALRCVCLDLDPAEDGLDALAAELAASDGEEQVSWRGNHRYVARLVLARDVPLGAQLQCRADGTYLIAGGLGGIGLATAQWLGTRGARRLVLLGRREPSAEASAALAELRRQGVEVIIAQASVADAGALARVLEAIPNEFPLRGVVSAASELDEGLLINQSWERFARVFAAKVWGSWNLHRLTRLQPLDFFVLYASAAGLVGSPGQGNYAAACAFEDGLALWRRGQGLPALSIDWGSWADIGIARQLILPGVTALPPAQAFALLDHLLTADVAMIAVLSADWAVLGPRFPTGSRYLSELASAGASSGQPSAEHRQWLKQYQQAPPSERPEMMQAFVRAQTAQVLGQADPHAIDPIKPLNELGLDSLLALELTRHMKTLAGRPLSPTLLFNHPTAASLSEFLGREVLGGDPVSAQSAKPSAGPGHGAELARLAEEVRSVSDAELDSVLSQLVEDRESSRE